MDNIFSFSEDNYREKLNNPQKFIETKNTQELFNQATTQENKRIARLNNESRFSEEENIKKLFR